MRATLRIASLALALAVVALASPAWSARVATARVGQHPQFTRIVFELDGQAGYRMERSVAPDGAPLVVVTLAASLAPDAPRKIRSGSSLIQSVSLDESQGRTVATIRLRGQALPVKEMMLTNPSRIVLDVVGTDTALAARAARPKAQAKSEPEPEPAPVAKTPEPAPKPVAKAPEPKPAPQAEAPKPAPAPVAEAPESQEPSKESEAEAAAREAMERRLAAVREAAEQRKEQLEEQRQQELEQRKAAQERLAEQRRRQQEEEAEAAPAQPAPPAGETVTRGSYLIGAVGGLLLFAVVVAIVMIRRRTLPKDLDVAAFSEDDDAADAEPGEEEHATEETPSDSSEPLMAAGPTQPPLSAPGLFEESEEESEKGESEMEPHAQGLPIERNDRFDASPAPSADVSGVIAELERRMSALEAKLQESNAARERLERQVAAQSEELRVQRAAIARTQRALRGLSRSEEEQATEPALRD